MSNIYLSTGNKKLKSSKEVKFLIFNLPAIKTCPFATEHCKALCYARKAEKMYPGCLPCREKNFMESKKESFVNDMTEVINNYVSRKAYKAAEKIFFRIHESGDFYNQEYFDKWVQIAKVFPNVTFLAYTKSVRYVLFTTEIIPENFIIRYSLWDDTKETEKSLCDCLYLPTYTAEYMTKEKIQSLGDRFCECKDCGTCRKCYSNEIHDIVTEIH